mmetsp:Transcript_13190/g.40613  ORF Transcript_13190/g.40613 Transcript_13190/m.40613 type:complete len:219 (-) Transcript_13190:434-1090(-)
MHEERVPDVRRDVRRLPRVFLLHRHDRAGPRADAHVRNLLLLHGDGLRDGGGVESPGRGHGRVLAARRRSGRSVKSAARGRLLRSRHPPHLVRFSFAHGPGHATRPRDGARARRARRALGGVDLARVYAHGADARHGVRHRRGGGGAGPRRQRALLDRRADDVDVDGLRMHAVRFTALGRRGVPRRVDGDVLPHLRRRGEGAPRRARRGRGDRWPRRQ